MTSDSSSFGGAALRTYQSYRYTITTMATGTKSRPIEAEMWYATPDASGKVGRWTYFGRYASAKPGDAARRGKSTSRTGSTGGWRPRVRSSERGSRPTGRVLSLATAPSGSFSAHYGCTCVRRPCALGYAQSGGRGTAEEERRRFGADLTRSADKP